MAEYLVREEEFNSRCPSIQPANEHAYLLVSAYMARTVDIQI